MTISKVFHTCTFGIYQNFSSQPLSQKVLRVSLGVLGLSFIGVLGYLTQIHHERLSTVSGIAAIDTRTGKEVQLPLTLPAPQAPTLVCIDTRTGQQSLL